jgi:hypothetical protein
MSEYQVLVGDLRTGKIWTRFSPTAGAWQDMLLGAGTMSCTVNVASPSSAIEDIFHKTATSRSFVAFQYGSVLKAAGPIWTRNYGWAAGTMSLGAAGIWSMFDSRLVIPVLAQPLALGAAQAATTTFPSSSNLSYGDMAAALVQQSLAGVGGNLPIVLPPSQGRTPGYTRTYPGYNLSWVGAMLKELTGVLNGPEIRFVPQYVPGDSTRIQWVMRVGTPTAPLLTQSGGDWIFDASVKKTMVSDYEYDEDATKMGTRAWEIGAGSQAGVLLSEADSTTLTSAGYPRMDVVDQSHSSVGDQSLLDSYAAQFLLQNNRPSVYMKVKVRNDGSPADSTPTPGGGGPTLDQYFAGDNCQLIIGNDPVLAPGARHSRIIQLDGNINPGVETTLTLAPMFAEV